MRKNRHNKLFAVLYAKGNVQLLTKEAKSHCAPLSQEQKDEHYPGIDLLSMTDVADQLGLLPSLSLLPLDNKKSNRARKKIMEHTSVSQKHTAILALAQIPQFLEDQRSGYIVLLLAFLSRIISYVPSDILSGIPSVCCGNLPFIPGFLRTVLSAVGGPDWAYGSNYSVRRPTVLEGERTFPGSPAFSTSLYDYLGGSLTLLDKDLTMWLPLWNKAVIVSSNLPQSVRREILSSSPSIIPFYCDGEKAKGIWSISIPGKNLYEADSAALDHLRDRISLVAAVVDSFFHKISKKPKQICNLFDDIGELSPTVHIGRAIAGIPTTEYRILAASLCVYRAFLLYVLHQGWINEPECKNLLMNAQEALSPMEETVPTSASVVVGDWNSPSAFWPFLSQFLHENSDHISSDTPRSVDTVAAIHTLRGTQTPLLIIPRDLAEAAYHEYCDTHSLFNGWSGADLTNCILSWNIGAKRDTGDPSWGYYFYSPKRKITCLGIPVKNLPSEIQEILPQA